MNRINKEILDFHDEYEGGGLLYEPWVSQKARDQFESYGDACSLLGEYIDKLYFVKVKELSSELRAKTLQRIAELESGIDAEVISILKKRVG